MSSATHQSGPCLGRRRRISDSSEKSAAKSHTLKKYCTMSLYSQPGCASSPVSTASSMASISEQSPPITARLCAVATTSCSAFCVGTSFSVWNTRSSPARLCSFSSTLMSLPRMVRLCRWNSSAVVRMNSACA